MKLTRIASSAGAPRRFRIFVGLAALGAVAVCATSASSHHSGAMFDQSKTVEIKGAVKSWLWTNPHSLLIVASRGANGQTVDYNFEANGPGYLVRSGWKRESVKPGDMVTITANPLRDGSPGGNLVEVAFADGHKLSARVVPTRPQATAPGLDAPAAGAPR